MLTIDVESELRKLSQAQLQGPWQVPAELARRALRAGATDVAITLGRHWARVVDDGRGVATESLQWTAVLLDPGRPNEERHAALTALESRGEVVLLALAGLRIKALRVEATADGGRQVLEFGEGRTPWVETQEGIAGQLTDVTVRSPELDRRQVAHFLASVCRFSHARITVDGREVSSGFDNVLAETALQPPLKGRIAIANQGDAARAWLLQHGLLNGHVTVPDSMPFEAAVELGEQGGDLSAARLREAVAPHAKELVSQGVALLVYVGTHYRNPPEHIRSRIARLLLRAATKGIRLQEVVRVPAFRVVDGDGHRCIDLATLRSSAPKGPKGVRILPALFPSQRPERFALGRTPVLIADAVERSRLAELMHVRFRPPDPRDGGSSVTAVLMRLVDGIGRGMSRAFDLVRHPFRAPVIPESALSATELALLEHLRESLPTLGEPIHGVEICAGGGPVRRSRGPEPSLMLPRGNPTVQAAVAVVAADPSWAYPAAVALLDGRSLPSAMSRRRWLERLG